MTSQKTPNLYVLRETLNTLSEQTRAVPQVRELATKALRIAARGYSAENDCGGTYDCDKATEELRVLWRNANLLGKRSPQYKALTDRLCTLIHQTAIGLQGVKAIQQRYAAMEPDDNWDNEPTPALGGDRW